MILPNKLHGCGFTVIGYDDDELDWIRELANFGGGRVLSGFDKRKTTHLITNDRNSEFDFFEQKLIHS